MVVLAAALSLPATARAEDTDAPALARDRVSLPVITTRQLPAAGRAGVAQIDGASRGPLRWLSVEAEVSRASLLSELDALSPLVIPDRYTQLSALRELAPLRWLDALDDAGAPPVVYVHGYNEGFAKAVRRALWLREKLELEGRLVLFTWPSDGEVPAYARDEADLRWSVTPLASAIAQLARHFGAGRVHLIGHSLGGRGVSHALWRALALNDQRPLVGEVALVAADIDAGVFAQLAPDLVAGSRRVTVYTRADDEPLAVSQTLHGYPRLGQSGAHNQQLVGVDRVAVDPVPRRRPSGHNYHLGSPVVQADLRAVLAGVPAGERGGLRPAAGLARHWALQPAGDGSD